MHCSYRDHPRRFNRRRAVVQNRVLIYSTSGRAYVISGTNASANAMMNKRELMARDVGYIRDVNASLRSVRFGI